MSAARRRSRKTAVDATTPAAQYEDKTSANSAAPSKPFGPVDVFTPNSWASRSQWLSSDPIPPDEQYSTPMMQELVQGKSSQDLLAARLLGRMPSQVAEPSIVPSDTSSQMPCGPSAGLRSSYKSAPSTPVAMKSSCTERVEESLAKSTSKPTPTSQSNTRRRQSASIPRPPNAWILYRASKAKQMLGSGKDKGGPSTNDNLGWPNEPAVGGAAHAIAKAASSETHLPFKQQQNLSKILASMWREESEENRAHWKALAEEKRLEHRLKYPEYRYGEVLDTRKKFDESVKEALALSVIAKEQESEGNKISNEQIAKVVMAAARRDERSAEEVMTLDEDQEHTEGTMSPPPKNFTRTKRALRIPKPLQIQTQSYAEEDQGNQSISDASSAEMVVESASPAKEPAREESVFPPTPQSASMAGLTRALELLDKFTASPTRMEDFAPTTAANSERTTSRKVIKKNAKESQAKTSPALKARRKSVSSQQPRRKSVTKLQSPTRRQPMTASQLEHPKSAEKDTLLQTDKSEKQRSYSLPQRSVNQESSHLEKPSFATLDFDGKVDLETSHLGIPTHDIPNYVYLDRQRRDWGDADQVASDLDKSVPTRVSKQSIFTPVRLLPLVTASHTPLQPFVTPSELEKRGQADPHNDDLLTDASPLDFADLLEAKQCAEQLLASMDVQHGLDALESDQLQAGGEDEMLKWENYGYLTLSEFCSPLSLVNEPNQESDSAPYATLSARTDQTPSSGSNESGAMEWGFNLLNCEMDLGFIEDVDIGMFAPQEREDERRLSTAGDSSLNSNEHSHPSPALLASDPLALLLSSLGHSDEQAIPSTLERDLSDILA